MEHEIHGNRGTWIKFEERQENKVKILKRERTLPPFSHLGDPQHNTICKQLLPVTNYVYFVDVFAAETSCLMITIAMACSPK